MTRNADPGIQHFDAHVFVHVQATKLDQTLAGVSNRVGNEILDDLFQEAGVGPDHVLTIVYQQLEPFCFRLQLELGRQPPEDVLHLAIANVGFDRARFELADVKQRVEQVGHRIQRVGLLFDGAHRPLGLGRLAEHGVQQAQSLQGLAQVVACGRQKRAFCPVGALGLVAGRGQLVLDSDAFGGIPDGARNQQAVTGFDLAQTDFHWEFAAVAPESVELEALTHRPAPRRRRVSVAMAEVWLAKTFRHQRLDRLADQLVRPVAEHCLGLGVDEYDRARRIDEHHRVGCRIQKCRDVCVFEYHLRSPARSQACCWRRSMTDRHGYCIPVDYRNVSRT